MRYQITLGGEQFDVDVTEGPGLPATARCLNADTPEISASSLTSLDAYEHVLREDGRRIEVLCADLLKRGHVTVRGLHSEGPVRDSVQVKSAQSAAIDGIVALRRPSSGGTLRAQMPGRIAKVLVKPGDKVPAGAPLLIVEAMKMENELVAPAPGTISAVHVTSGQTVEGGAPLVDLSPSVQKETP